MARKTKAAAAPQPTAVEVVGPNFARALSVLRNDVKPLDEQSAEVRGNQSAAWKTVEKDCRVNKRAAKVFLREVYNASEESKDDFLRSFYGLMREAGMGISRDLVDLAGDGEPEGMPVVEARAIELPTTGPLN